MGFQNRVNSQPAPAVAGDFAGNNPRTSVSAPSGGYTAAPDLPATFGAAPSEALIVGRFAWANYQTGLMANYFQPTSLLGFVERQVNATIIKDFLGEKRLGFQQGFPCTSHGQGDFWADFAPGPGTAGKVVYADPVTGVASLDVTGQSVKVTGFTATIVAATGVMTLIGAPTTAAAGQVVVGAGIPPGTHITGQLTGTAGQAGTYQLNQSPAADISGAETVTLYGKQETRWKLTQPIAGASSFTGQFLGTVVSDPNSPFNGDTVANGILTVTGGVTGQPLAAGQLLSDQGANKNLTPAAQILGQLTGTVGGNGTYTTNVFIVQGASESMTAGQGTLGKISTWQA